MMKEELEAQSILESSPQSSNRLRHLEAIAVMTQARMTARHAPMHTQELSASRSISRDTLHAGVEWRLVKA
jgi:hypothetical protein